jgi:hypothetical protein
VIAALSRNIVETLSDGDSHIFMLFVSCLDHGLGQRGKPLGLRAIEVHSLSGAEVGPEESKKGYKPITKLEPTK